MAKNPGLTANGVSGSHFDALEKLEPGLGRAINAALAQVANSTSELGGFKGTVKLRNKTKLSKVGKTDATLDTDMGRIASVADGKNDTDAVNVRQLRAATRKDPQDDPEIDPLDIQKAACSPPNIGHLVSAATQLDTTHAIQVFNEIVYVLGEIVGVGYIETFRIDFDNSLVPLNKTALSLPYQKMLLHDQHLYLCKTGAGSHNLERVSARQPRNLYSDDVLSLGVAAFNLHAQGRFVYVATSNQVKVVETVQQGMKVIGGAS